MSSEIDSESDSTDVPTPEIDGSLRDSPITTIAIVVVLSLVLVGAAYAFFAPAADIVVEENADGSTTVTVAEVDGYEDVVLQYEGEEVVLEEGESAVLPEDTEYSVIGVLNETESILQTGST